MITHPACIVPGRAFSFVFRIGFPGEKGKKHAQKLHRIKFEITEKCTIKGSTGPDKESLNSVYSWNRMVGASGMADCWSNGPHGPVYSDKVRCYLFLGHLRFYATELTYPDYPIRHF